MNEHILCTMIALLALCGAAGAESPANAPKDGIILSAPLTHSDWMVHSNAPAWGPDGIRHMLEQCKACGWKRVYWRVFDAGRAVYPSKLLDPMKYDTAPAPNCLTTGELGAQAPPDLVARAMKIDYKDTDTLKDAIRIGHELGLEVHAWMTINEDDHGWGWQSRFSAAHPEYRWVRRDGRPYHSQLSFAFPEVRAYKLALVKEMLDYDVDGIFLDWIRTGDIRDNPQNDGGVANYGYETANIAAFKKKYGADPHDVDNGDYRWVKIRAEPITDFMRSVRSEVKKHKKKVVLSAMVHHRWAYRGRIEEGGTIDGSLRGILCDVRAWAREGLVDEMVAAGYYTSGGNPEAGYRDLEEETEGRVPLWLYCWVPNTPDEFQRDLALARKLGVRQMLFWEADYIDVRPQPQRDAIMKAMCEASDRK